MKTTALRPFDAATIDATLPTVATEWPELADAVRAAQSADDRHPHSAPRRTHTARPGSPRRA